MLTKKQLKEAQEKWDSQCAEDDKLFALLDEHNHIKTLQTCINKVWEKYPPKNQIHGQQAKKLHTELGMFMDYWTKNVPEAERLQQLRLLAFEENLSLQQAQIAEEAGMPGVVENIYKKQKKTWEHRWDRHTWTWQVQDPETEKWETSPKRAHQPKTPELNEFCQAVLKPDQTNSGLSQTFNLPKAQILELIARANKLLPDGVTLPELDDYDYKTRQQIAFEQALGGEVSDDVMAKLTARMALLTPTSTEK